MLDAFGYASLPINTSALTAETDRPTSLILPLTSGSSTRPVVTHDTITTETTAQTSATTTATDRPQVPHRKRALNQVDGVVCDGDANEVERYQVSIKRHEQGARYVNISSYVFSIILTLF